MLPITSNEILLKICRNGSRKLILAVPCKDLSCIIYIDCNVVFTQKVEILLQHIKLEESKQFYINQMSRRRTGWLCVAPRCSVFDLYRTSNLFAVPPNPLPLHQC